MCGNAGDIDFAANSSLLNKHASWGKGWSKQTEFLSVL